MSRSQANERAEIPLVFPKSSELRSVLAQAMREFEIVSLYGRRWRVIEWGGENLPEDLERFLLAEVSPQLRLGKQPVVREIDHLWTGGGGD